MKFRLLSGVHNQDGKRYTKGQVVETDHDLVKLFPQKFELIGEAAPAKGKKAWEDDEEEEVPTKATAKHTPASQIAHPTRTMRG